MEIKYSISYLLSAAFELRKNDNGVLIVSKLKLYRSL